MEYIRHRVNSIAELDKLPATWGAEIDLRTRGNEIVLQHEPFLDGESFAAFVAVWARKQGRGPLVLNPKEDGLEARAIEILASHRIDNFFLIDVSPPTQIRMAFREGFSHFAARVSEYESVASATVFAQRARWVWVDCFSGEPPKPYDLDILRELFRVCLVSPEVHRYPMEAVERFRPLRHHIDAVCTKIPDLWQ